MYEGERFNSISHLIGAIAGLAGLVVLVVDASYNGDAWKIVSFSIYGSTLLFLYLASTLYHSFRGRAKKIFQMLDYHAVYLLIAGTYTPVTLVTLRGAWGWSIFGVIWGLALIGIFIDSFPSRGRSVIRVVIYLIMGWMILIAIGPLWDHLPSEGFMWLLIGCAFYTSGVYFYIKDEVRHYHGIWHLFVMAGSVTHYFTILYFI